MIRTTVYFSLLALSLTSQSFAQENLLPTEEAKPMVEEKSTANPIAAATHSSSLCKKIISETLQREPFGFVEKVTSCTQPSKEALTPEQYFDRIALEIDQNKGTPLAKAIANIPTYPTESASFCVIEYSVARVPLQSFWTRERTDIRGGRYAAAGELTIDSIARDYPFEAPESGASPRSRAARLTQLTSAPNLIQAPYFFQFHSREDKSLISFTLAKRTSEVYRAEPSGGNRLFLAYQDIPSIPVFREAPLVKVVRVSIDPDSESVSKSQKGAFEFSHQFTFGPNDSDHKTIQYTGSLDCQTVTYPRPVQAQKIEKSEKSASGWKPLKALQGVFKDSNSKKTVNDDLPPYESTEATRNSANFKKLPASPDSRN
jgi:hypothetical protein